MPITRRKRANPPDQPENTNTPSPGQPETTAEIVPTEPASAASTEGTATPPTLAAAIVEPEVAAPQAENGSYQAAQPTQPVISSQPPVVHAPAVNGSNGERASRHERAERTERSERAEKGERQEYTPPIEGGRRTARGELFRRPPQPPQQQVVVSQPPAPTAPPPLQPPSHEITLPLGKRPGDTLGDPLHLAYNPGYTGADEVRSALLHHLVQESKTGGRARCWNCGSIAIVYDRWNTRSKTFGEIGVAICEICGVWSVM